MAVSSEPALLSVCTGCYVRHRAGPGHGRRQSVFRSGRGRGAAGRRVRLWQERDGLVHHGTPAQSAGARRWRPDPSREQNCPPNRAGRDVASASIHDFQHCTSLNPVFTIGDQLIETIRWHERMGRLRRGTACGIEMLDKSASRLRRSVSTNTRTSSLAGMCQRVMLIALACTPALLLADEPTTALDVTIQAQILDLLGTLQQEFKMAVILITHDLGVVAQFVDRVAVMYAGRLVETGSVTDVFERPTHPYTSGVARRASRRWRTSRIARLPSGFLRCRPDAGSSRGVATRSLACSLAEPPYRARDRACGRLHQACRLPRRGDAAMSNAPALVQVEALTNIFRW